MKPGTFVRIVNPKAPGGALVLHSSDFDPAVHTLFVEAPVSIDVEPVTPAEPTGPVVVELTTPLSAMTDAVIERLAEVIEANVTQAKAARVRKPKPASTTETP